MTECMRNHYDYKYAYLYKQMALIIAKQIKPLQLFNHTIINQLNFDVDKLKENILSRYDK